MRKQTQPYGTWNSIISSTMLAGETRLMDVAWDTQSDTLVWLERRGGNTVLLAQSGLDAPRTLTDDSLKLGGGVGYGGGTFTVHQGIVYFVANNRIYKQSLQSGFAQAITPEFGRSAAPSVSGDGAWVAFVHHYEDKDVLAIVDSDGVNWSSKLLTDADFVMQPAWHPNGQMLACITWNHPNMPWNATELRLLHIDRSSGVPQVTQIETVAGDTNTAIFQPEFSPDGRTLAYVSDQSGMGQIHLYDLQSGVHTQISDDEFDHGYPAWIQGMQTYRWVPDSSAIISQRQKQARYSLCRYDLATTATTTYEALEPYTQMEQLAVSPVTGEIAVIASAPNIPKRVISYSPNDGVRVRQRSTNENIPEDAYALMQNIRWKGHDDEWVYGLYTPPRNTAYEGEGKPPLLVKIHSGPTSQTPVGYDLETQFFATRGFAVLHVNYRGSTGFGKAYMDKLREHWGIYDVEDSISGAQYLIDEGLIDPEKLVVFGSSAGGFSVLHMLVNHPGIFKAGIAAYPVSNQFTMAQDTHKFERYYNDWLLGKLPEAAQTYRARSPFFHAHQISDGLILFHGGQDAVVPCSQSDKIASALQRSGIPFEYHVFDDEGHGWRKPETVAVYYEKIIDFLIQHVIYN